MVYPDPQLCNPTVTTKQTELNNRLKFKVKIAELYKMNRVEYLGPISKIFNEPKSLQIKEAVVRVITDSPDGYELVTISTPMIIST